MFKINGVDFQHPDGLVMQRQENIISTVKVMDGSTKYDICGWIYAPVVFTWAYLNQEQINALLTATASQFIVTFDDLQGTHTVNAIRTTTLANKSFRFNNGALEFSGVSLGVSFPDAYNAN